jgi:hypothetical protein
MPWQICTTRHQLTADFAFMFGACRVFVVWLDAVTYLHHHGITKEKMPWYRGEEWSYLRGGLTTLDQDFGIFNKIHHNIETHVVHHLVSSSNRKLPGGGLGNRSTACGCMQCATRSFFHIPASSWAT